MNVALCIARARGARDPRQQHSGNPGVVNVYRVWGFPWAALVLLLDVGRALSVAFLALWLVPRPAVPWVGLALIVGNQVPLFHGFRGGKGVANYLGFTAGVAPVAALASTVAWLGGYALTRRPFLGSFAMIATLAIGTAVRLAWHPAACVGTAVTVTLIVWSHRQNLAGHSTKRRANDG